MELNIDRGLKSYDVKDADGTLIGTIRFNPSDIGLAGRMEEARTKIAEITAAPVTGPEDLVEWDRQVRHWFDYIFGTPVSDVFFAGVSSLAFCEDGSLVAEAVLTQVANESKDATVVAFSSGDTDKWTELLEKFDLTDTKYKM